MILSHSKKELRARCIFKLLPHIQLEMTQIFGVFHSCLASHKSYLHDLNLGLIQTTFLRALLLNSC